ncbi:MAG: hypothetical protein HY782_26755 [Chloroflexi bacterium]|nr:hypothetical protein [Chloroflexota bacterium]
MAEENPSLPSQSDAPRSATWLARLRGVLHGPVLVGVVAALIAIGLSVFGMVRNPDATPLNLRSLLLVVVLAGGSWGLIAWAIATAAVEAGKD